MTRHVEEEKNSILNSGDWAKLPEADRASFSERLDELALGEARDLDGMRALLNRRIEIDSALAQIRRQVQERAKQTEPPPSPPPPPPRPPGGPKPEPRKLKLPRRIEAVDLPPVIKDLQDAHQQGAGVELDLE